jgi:hypothetical protein
MRAREQATTLIRFASLAAGFGEAAERETPHFDLLSPLSAFNAKRED